MFISIKFILIYFLLDFIVCYGFYLIGQTRANKKFIEMVLDNQLEDLFK